MNVLADVLSGLPCFSSHVNEIQLYIQLFDNLYCIKENQSETYKIHLKIRNNLDEKTCSAHPGLHDYQLWTTESCVVHL